MKRKINMLLLSSLVIFSSNEVLKAQNWLTSGNTLTGTLPSSPNEYIGSTNNANLRFLTNSSVNMVITSTGKIGMGVGAPVYGLELGNLSSAGSLSSGGSFLIGLLTEGSAAVGNESVNKHAVFGSMTTNKDILFPTYNGTSFDERMRITSSGDVGIGTSSPANKLDVLATTPIVRVGISSGTTSYAAFTAHDISANTSLVQLMGGSAMGGTLFGVSRAGLGQFYTNDAPLVIGTVQADDLTLGTSNTGRITVKSAGNVGIGTVVPASKLDVEGGVAIGASYSGSTAAPTDGAIIQGKVGIGTSGPGARLDVYTTTASEVAVKGTNQATSGSNYGGAFYGIGSGASTNYGVFANASGATTNYNLYLGSLAASANNYSIYSVASAKSYIAGDLGIGTTAPSQKLEVNGNVAINGNCTRTGTDNFTSDQMFKTNIDSIHNALAVIKQLKPKTYYFDTTNVYGLNFPSKKSYGFVAQDLEQILPELVSTNNKNADVDTLGNIIHPAVTYKGVYYVEFISILTKGIQELQQKNDSLQTELNKQDAVNTLQQNQMDLIQNQLVANTTLFQEQLNQLTATINTCCNRPQQSSTNTSETKSIIISENGTTQTDVELNNSQTTVLEQNHPNPYAERTSINYYLPENTGKAEIRFYNTQGKLIKSVELIQKGKGTLNVFASDLSSGVYSYSLIVDGQIVETKKMIKN